MSHIAVTGANGFVGRAVVRALLASGHQVTAFVRRAVENPDVVRECIMDSVESASWPADVVPDAVIHLAARVHVMRENTGDPLAAFRDANVAGALQVAEAAHCAGTRRLVFVSSIKAVGEADSGRPLREDDPPQPQDPYGISKLEAERALTRFGEETGLEVVIVRPPLVYGPEVRANFLHLTAAVAKGIPLPLGTITARRSLVYNENLADALVLCATDARAAGECFHVTDGADMTVAELARALGYHLHTKARLLPVPESWLRVLGKLTRRSPQVERLIGELRVDSSHIHKVLQWQPRYTVDEGLAATAKWYRSTH
ncbi:UDP-glucose 4-epimerase family protein [Paraburkholderia kirstenboschensis]|uniref:SDR family oxidoreductase n=1 Tax=Paraburkholderia kirstenboschensis TaxID=1245436 RepID=A0ABZ0ERH1_9BURK|nr:SDR family oxidoreductase [Paraburkholderia kirstenboschensis]WOD18683.1 SDR family oxidoreductase [Paraburkholderia kirstenboschensis]